jgi:hypothetical protein
MFLGSRVVLKAVNLTAICEPTVYRPPQPVKGIDLLLLAFCMYLESLKHYYT